MEGNLVNECKHAPGMRLGSLLHASGQPLGSAPVVRAVRNRCRFLLFFSSQKVSPWLSFLETEIVSMKVTYNAAKTITLPREHKFEL